MMLELFVGFTILLGVVIIISVIKHVFGLIFKLAVLFLVLLVIIAGIGAIELAQRGVFSESFTMLYVDSDILVGGIDIRDDRITVLNETVIGSVVSEDSLQNYSENKLLVIMEGSFDERDIEEDISRLNTSVNGSSLKTSLVLYDIATDDDVEDLSLYPKTTLISAIDVLLG